MTATPTLAHGAGAILSRATRLLLDGDVDLTDDLLDDGRIDSPAGPLSAWHVAAGGAALIARMVQDVEAVLSVDRGETLHRLGRWVAHQEVLDGQS